MTTLQGTAAGAGIAFGKIAVYRRREDQVKRVHVEQPELELERLEQALMTADTQLEELYQKALTEMGEAEAAIFDIHRMMLEDADYRDSIRSMIQTQGVNAEFAAAATGDNFARMFSEMGDEYMRGRASDVRDVSGRLVTILSGRREAAETFPEPVILLADDLTPSETIQLDKDSILAFVTEKGSASSHTAILARTMNIPAVVGIGTAIDPAWEGREAVVDGASGTVLIDPDEETAALLRARAADDAAHKALLEQLRGKESKTQDGVAVKLYANIGGIGDVANALQNDAEGVGLFRSEFLYLESDHYPTENEQFQAYKLVAENMAGKKVIIRTLDIGADKKIAYFDLPEEENPAMGYRAIRICLDRPELFKTQLRAIYRASAFGNLSIMFPMITSVEEVRAIKEIVSQVLAELEENRIPYAKDVELGVMIETPAAAMISDDLAGEVDFFSIGTNDLTQYTLAVDRQNPNLSAYYNPRHKGLLRMIRLVADNAHKAEIWVGICGELAADTELTETFLAMGIDELSVSPPQILPVREKIRNSNVKAGAEAALAKLL